MLPQARSQAIEAQLASTVAELCNLRVRQQQLESRNLLLEKCSNLTNRQTPEQLNGVSVAVAGLNCLLPFCGLTQILFLQDGPYERLYIAHETDASENGPSVTISVRGGRQKMTVQEMSVMPVAEFALLWMVSLGSLTKLL